MMLISIGSSFLLFLICGQTVTAYNAGPSELYIRSIYSVTSLVLKSQIDEGSLDEFAKVADVLRLIGVNKNRAISKCQQDFAIISKLSVIKVPWALKYLDAQAKPPSGVFQGAGLWYGDFDECLGIERFDNGKTAFGPRYCYTGISARNITSFQEPTLVQFFPAIMYGICVPDSCSEKDVVDIVNSEVPKLGFHAVLELTHCAELPPPLDALAYVAIICYSGIGFLLACGLIIDLYLRFKQFCYPNIPAGKSLADEDRSLTIVGHFADLLINFSPLTNFEKLYRFPTPTSNARVGLPDFSCINAIRTLSLFWVLLGHFYSFTLAFCDNLYTIGDMSTSFIFQFVIGGFFAVDSFFFLSGFLAYWSLAKIYATTRRFGKFLISLPTVYLYRLIRLTPPYASALLLDVALWKYLGNGPFYFQGTDANCLKHWWNNLLYINNFIDTFHNCLPWSWYLAVDMQLFLFAPFIVFAFVKKPIVGWLLCIIGLAAQIITSATLTAVHNLPLIQYPPQGYIRSLNGTEPKDFQGYTEEYYGKPYTRAGPYIIGLIACHLIVKHQSLFTSKILKNRLAMFMLWLTSFAVVLALVYGNYGYFSGAYLNPDWVDALYNSVARTAWAIALAWILIACSLQAGGIVGRILSWPLWTLPARLSYAAYLIHPFVFLYYAQTSRRPLNLTDLSVIYAYCGNVVIVMLLSTVFTLAFESPLIGLLKGR